MAGGFFALLDDVASLLDDVAAMTKVATKKTAGVLGDDLALNANQLTGIQASRELPIIWAVSKGSLLNKALIVPVAFLLSAFLPAAVPLVLMIGGAYLCYEGVEKILHRLLHHGEADAAVGTDNRDPAQIEQEKIRAAIRTDFILSLEIIVIALASFVGKPLLTQILGLSAVALILTAAVYGVVALIVKMDDLGLYWAHCRHRLLQWAGRALLWFAPKLLKALSVAGTAAMFIVGGHLWVENIGALHHLAQHWTQGLGGFAAWWVDAAFSVAVGSVVGLALYAATAVLSKIRNKRR
jgi:membrane protein